MFELAGLVAAHLFNDTLLQPQRCIERFAAAAPQLAERGIFALRRAPRSSSLAPGFERSF